jgi:hypothetical protein
VFLAGLQESPRAVSVAMAAAHEHLRHRIGDAQLAAQRHELGLRARRDLEEHALHG